MKKSSLAGFIKPAFILLTALSTLLIVSCGGGKEGSSQTPGEKILEAIDGTWTVPVTGIPSDAAAVIHNATITISTSSTGASFVSDNTSGLDNFILGGSFNVASDGTVSSPVINAASDLSFSTPTISASTSSVSISFAASAARQDGIGTWNIVIPID